MEKLLFEIEGEEPAEFYVLEQTRLGGNDYLLVSDTDDEDDEDGIALILKDLAEDGETESRYVIVEEEEELNAVAEVFESMLDGLELEP